MPSPETPQTSRSFQSSSSRKRSNTSTWTKKRDQFIEAGIRVLQQEGSQVDKNIPEPQEITFGKNVGQQLKDIEQRQKIIAQKLISDILFHAKLGNLHDSSMITLVPQPAAYQLQAASYIRQPQVSQQTYSATANLPSTSTQSATSNPDVMEEFMRFHN